LLAFAVIIVVASVFWGAREIAREVRGLREEAARGRALAILQMCAPGLEAVRRDPRALLVWQRLARTTRQLFPSDCEALDKAAGGTFPFSVDQIQGAHAQWTADWLAWERNHDATYKQRAAELEQEIVASGGSAAARGRLDAVEREKLDLYQRRYQEYVQVAKALQGLIG